MKTHPAQSRPACRKGFTLTEVLIAAFISAIAIGAAISLTITALKIYYVDSDYLEIGARQRRLSDDLIEKVSRANDLVVYYDLADPALTIAGNTDRGDCLVVVDRDMATANGPITVIHCYHLGRIPLNASGSGPVGLWYFMATPASTPVSDVSTALANYTRSGSKQLSGEMFRASLPRPAPPTVVPPAAFIPREGIFTVDRSRVAAGIPPSVQVTIPTRLNPSSAQEAKSTFNFAVSLRR